MANESNGLERWLPITHACVFFYFRSVFTSAAAIFSPTKGS